MIYKSEKLNNINPSIKNSWKNKFFFTCDIDWAPDFILEETVEIFRKYGVKLTFFSTHHNKYIESLCKDDLFEFGIHPNFNNNLDQFQKNSKQIISELMDFFPKAKSVRSHSLMQSEQLVDQFKEAGITHISNFYLPLLSKIKIYPFYLWDKMIITPHMWQDNVEIKMHYIKKNYRFKIIPESLNVINFHPIHFYLNTIDLDLYNKVKRDLNNYKILKKNINTSFGIKNILIKLINKFKKT